MRDGEPGWFYIGDGQLQYKDNDGWTQRYQNIDEVTATQRTKSGSPGAADATVSPTMSKRRRGATTLKLALCAALLGLGAAAGLTHPEAVRGWASWATVQAGRVSDLVAPSAPPTQTTTEDARARATAAKAAAAKAAHARAVAHAKAVARQSASVRKTPR